jgi:uncharacterized membrane protein
MLLSLIIWPIISLVVLVGAYVLISRWIQRPEEKGGGVTVGSAFVDLLIPGIAYHLTWDLVPTNVLSMGMYGPIIISLIVFAIIFFFLVKKHGFSVQQTLGIVGSIVLVAILLLLVRVSFAIQIATSLM